MSASAILCAVACVLALAASSVSSQDMLGHNDATLLTPDPTSNCSVGTLYRNDDGSIENAYAWDLGGIAPPYYGAWGEAYDLGPGNVACGTFWFTQTGYHWGRGMDVYVWDGGVSRDPGPVIFLLPDVVPTFIPFWPECGENRFYIGCDVTSEFTLGFWADFSHDIQDWYVCADENGPGGYPWTCISPAQPHYTGWHHVNVVFPDCKSMVIGPLFNPRDPAGVDECPEGGPPAESPTWGQIKAIFGR